MNLRRRTIAIGAMYIYIALHPVQGVAQSFRM
jgi:hypothetical protein